MYFIFVVCYWEGRVFKIGSYEWFCCRWKFRINCGKRECMFYYVEISGGVVNCME